jgi:1-acyl-sn-glycerol-3-phosphate acyltransferase
MLFRIARALAVIITRVTIGLLGGLRVDGLENVPREGGVIIAPNHVSFADPPAVGVAIGRPAYFMATSELFARPILGRLCGILHAFPVEQDSPDRSALRHTVNLLKSGEAVVVFPEGHVSHTDAMLPLQPGIVMLAVHAYVPIVPVGITGTAQMMPPGGFKLRLARRSIEIRFGTPITPEELTGGLKGRAATNHGVRLLTLTIERLIAASAKPELVSEIPDSRTRARPRIR